MATTGQALLLNYQYAFDKNTIETTKMPQQWICYHSSFFQTSHQFARTCNGTNLIQIDLNEPVILSTLIWYQQLPVLFCLFRNSYSQDS